jgi:hypothetical protein
MSQIAKRLKRRQRLRANSRGWAMLLKCRPFPNENHPLVEHFDLPGPVKFVQGDPRPVSRTEVHIPTKLKGANDWDYRNESADLIRDLEQGVFSPRRRKFDNWEPPQLEQVTDWLRELGHEVKVDPSTDLRLSIPSRGSNGRVRFNQRRGLFRLTLVLGEWEALDPVAESAMLSLAQVANDQCHLVRIGWDVVESQRRCEVQADLTGLPVQPKYGVFWRENLRLALAGIELAQRRLGLELDVLSHPDNRALAARLSGIRYPPRRPK